MMRRPKLPFSTLRAKPAASPRPGSGTAGDGDASLPLVAGDFSSWVVEMNEAMGGVRASGVPCGGCTACCTSSQFVHIGPDELDTLAHVPAALRFAAPGLPRGHVLLGYDERGHCPMLIDGQCSIYEHRPRTCRTYDCRVFPAAGLDADDDKVLIVRQARRWAFSFSSENARSQHEAVRAAARFLEQHRDQLPSACVPANATQLAVLALQIHEIFLRRDEETDCTTIVEPDLDAVSAEVERRTKALRAK